MVVDVVIPALDEEATIAAVVAGVRETPVRQVVVVDNGSRDRTAERAVEAGAVVVLESRAADTAPPAWRASRTWSAARPRTR